MLRFVIVPISIHSRYIQIIRNYKLHSFERILTLCSTLLGVVIMNISRVRVEYIHIANHKHIAVSHFQNSGQRGPRRAEILKAVELEDVACRVSGSNRLLKVHKQRQS